MPQMPPQISSRMSRPTHHQHPNTSKTPTSIKHQFLDLRQMHHLSRMSSSRHCVWIQTHVVHPTHVGIGTWTITRHLFCLCTLVQTWSLLSQLWTLLGWCQIWSYSKTHETPYSVLLVLCHFSYHWAPCIWWNYIWWNCIWGTCIWIHARRCLPPYRHHESPHCRLGHS